MNIVGLSKRFLSPRFSDRIPIIGLFGRSFHQLRRPGNFVAPRVFFVSSCSRNLSTNASSPSKQNGFLRWYLRKLDSHPFMTKSITTSLIYMAADLTSQVRLSRSTFFRWNLIPFMLKNLLSFSDNSVFLGCMMFSISLLITDLSLGISLISCFRKKTPISHCFIPKTIPNWFGMYPCVKVPLKLNEMSYLWEKFCYCTIE